MENDALAEQAAKNSREQFAEGGVRKAIITQAKVNDRMAGQLVENDDKLRAFTELLIDMLYDGLAKRAKGAGR